MSRIDLRQRIVTLFATFAFVCAANGQTLVTGVSDKGVYTDRVTLRVPIEQGFAYSVLLNGTPASVGDPITITKPDFYILDITRTAFPNGVTTRNTIRFIVVNAARANTEW